MAKAVPVLSDDPSRDEELAFLQAVIGRVPANSYLAALFSDGLVEWFGQQMRWDFSCDLHEIATKALADEVEALSAKVRLESDIMNLEARLKAEREATQRAVAVGDETAEHWRTEAGYWRREAGSAADEVESLREMLRQRDEQNLALKARLFDLCAELGRI